MASDPNRYPVFVSYRRGSGSDVAENLAKAINGAFGDETAFLDRLSIEPTTDWPTELEQAVAGAKLLVVIVTEDWLKRADRYGKRLIDHDDDWCRREVEVALTSGIAICPVLVDGFAMPEPEGLPSSIAGLARCNGIDWRSDAWAEGVERLRKVVEPLLEAGDDGVSPQLALLRRFGACLVRAHSRLVTLFPQSEKGLEEIYVEVLVGVAEHGDGDDDEDDRGGRAAKSELGITDEGPIARAAIHRKMSLRELMATGGGAPDGRAFVVLGEPGAGKSTVARHLALTLGRALMRRTEPLGPEDPVPVYVSLPSLTGPSSTGSTAAVSDPLAVAEQAACSGENPALLAGLGKLLDAVATGLQDSSRAEDRSAAGVTAQDGQTGVLWLLLDGLDEVGQQHMGKVRQAIHGWVERFPNARIAVFSRVIDYRPLGPPFQAVRLAPLQRDDKQQLLRGWLGAEAAGFLAQLDHSPEMSVLAGNPLLLTLLAKLWLTQDHVPAHRLAMYDAAIDMLLRTSHDEQRDPIRAPSDVRVVLRQLALELQGSATSAWTIEELSAALWQCRNQEVSVDRPIQSIWGGDNEAFLSDVERLTGIVTSDAAVGSTWTFLHRQFREFLAAEAIAKGSRSWDEIVDSSADGLPRWSETIGMYCGLAKEPMSVLERLRESSPEATMKALAEVDGRAAGELFEFVWSVPSEIEGWSWSEEQPSRYRWDGEDLLRLVDAWVRRGRWTVSEARAALLGRVGPKVGTAELSWCYYVLSSPGLGGVPDPAEFFERAGRPMPDPGEFDWVSVPAGGFEMGSPEDEPERYDDEGPQHEVRVPEFGLLRFAVTNGQYARFDPGHEAERFDGKVKDPSEHPVVNVDWWGAYLFSAWIGGRLPSEAEWEYGCRAGTRGPFSFEGELTPELVNYNGNYPYDGAPKGEYRKCTVPVGELPANGWACGRCTGTCGSGARIVGRRATRVRR